MTLSNIRELIRAYVPSAKVSVVPDALLDIIINAGVRDVNAIAFALRGDAKFNVSAEIQTYALSVEVSDFVTMAPGGLWWNRGTASSVDWVRLDAMDRRSLDDLYPRWMSNSSDNPLRYILENDVLSIDPKPSADLTDGFWLFYVKKPVDMSADGHYPFSGTTTEIGALSILDEAIIDYSRWKLARPLGAQQMGVITEQDYRKNLNEKIAILNTRLDITANPNLRMRGPNIG